MTTQIDPSVFALGTFILVCLLIKNIAGQNNYNGRMNLEHSNFTKLITF